jgi:hypothetical protein
MKKSLLLLSLCVLATVVNAQVIFYVEAPSPNEGNYDFTYADAADWSTPDMTDPANAISAEMVLVDDGSGLENPIACTDVINDLSGKIAVLYRGSCEFGVKALNAQEQGAIGVIIINNLPGAPVAMGGGTDGALVNVPVVMITNTDGALLRDEIDAGTTTVFIGSKNGLYSNDIGMTQADLLRAKRFGNIQALSQSAEEFEVEIGSWVRNYGTNDQSGVVLNVTIELDGSELYNENSDPVTIPSGDSAYIPLPTFSQEAYANGYYEMTYSVQSDATDESGFDNVQSADFNMSENLFSMARLDSETELPVNETNQFNGTTTTLLTCLPFEDANASRVSVTGLNYSAGTSQNPDPTSLDGQLVEFIVYAWEDEFVDLDDPDFNISILDDVATGEYIYTEDLQSENVFIELEEPVRLEDDQRYLFCVLHFDNFIYPGYDTKIDYNMNVEEYRTSSNPIQIDDNWFALGYGTDRNPAFSVNFGAPDLGLVELPEMELTAYPNPAQDIVRIPLDYQEGTVALSIVDMNGRVVEQQNVTMSTNRLDVDVTSLSSGMYAINLVFASGEKGSINVVVTK